MNHNYPEYGFGLVLTVDEIEDFVNRLDAKINAGMNGDPQLLVDNLGDDYGAKFYGDDMEGKHFYNHDGTVDLEEDDMLAFWAKHQPNAIKAAYDDIEAVEEEFRLKLGEFLPEDFDYKAHIGYFQCVIYC